MPSADGTDTEERHEAPRPATPPPERGRQRRGAQLIKHGADRASALLILIVVSPLLAVVALALWRWGEAGVLSREVRLGEYGRVYNRLSFAVTDAMRGRRAWRLVAASGAGSLPLMVNVLRGEMSLVGPLPRAPGAAPPPARPGLTGLAQLEQLDGAVEPEALEELDRRYAREWSLKLDLRILALTLLGGVRRSSR
jgi:lipopolysaccharide/colanic/teichoic acid biosynthesis glycosyltransferase